MQKQFLLFVFMLLVTSFVNAQTVTQPDSNTTVVKTTFLRDGKLITEIRKTEKMAPRLNEVTVIYLTDGDTTFHNIRASGFDRDGKPVRYEYTPVPYKGRPIVKPKSSSSSSTSTYSNGSSKSDVSDKLDVAIGLDGNFNFIDCNLSLGFGGGGGVNITLAPTCGKYGNKHAPNNIWWFTAGYELTHTSAIDRSYFKRTGMNREDRGTYSKFEAMAGVTSGLYKRGVSLAAGFAMFIHHGGSGQGFVDDPWQQTSGLFAPAFGMKFKAVLFTAPLIKGEIVISFHSSYYFLFREFDGFSWELSADRPRANASNYAHLGHGGFSVAYLFGDSEKN